MDTTHLVLLFIAVGLIAFLYSSVGHAGASGYIAMMTLFGLAPTVIRPTALVLNILVASIGDVSILASRSFLVEIILAFCAAFHSGRVPWRLSSTVCFRFPNPDWRCPSFFGHAIGVSAERSAANSHSFTARGN